MANIAAETAGNIARVLRRSGRRLPVVGVTLEGAVRDKVVLVTGSSSGIGRAAAVQLGAAGATVLVMARGAEALAEVVAEIEADGGVAHAHPCDLADEEAVDRVADEILAAHGRVDILVNNAGRSIRRSVARSDERIHDFRRTMEINYFGALKLVLRFLPGMRERRSGQIVNVSTMGVQVRTPRFSAYLASKAAMDAFSSSLATEVVQYGIHVSTVFMPLVRTPMIEPTDHYRRFPALSPEEAGDLVCRAIVTRQKRVTTLMGRVSELSYLTAPAIQDVVMNAGYRMFPESAASKEAVEQRSATSAEPDPGEPEPDPAESDPGEPDPAGPEDLDPAAALDEPSNDSA